MKQQQQINNVGWEPGSKYQLNLQKNISKHAILVLTNLKKPKHTGS